MHSTKPGSPGRTASVHQIFGLVETVDPTLIITALTLLVLLTTIIPASVTASLLVGRQKKQTKPRATLLRAAKYASYHTAMLAIWLFTWPQLYNDVHSGYALSALPAYLLLMVLWTAQGAFIIFIFREFTQKPLKENKLLWFGKLYVWHLAVKFTYRQIIFFFITL